MRVCCAASLLTLLCAPGGAYALQSEKPPLAYVRTLRLSAPALSLSEERAVPARPVTKDRKVLRAWESRFRAREDTHRLRQAASGAIRDSLVARLAKIPGLALTEGDSGALTDASLRVEIDRIGLHSGMEREFWLRAAVTIRYESAARPRRTFYALGRAVAARGLIRRGFTKTDDQLLAAAAESLSRQALHALQTGEEAPFTRSCRIAIVPADVPSAGEKEIEGTPRIIQVGLPSLVRQADVLLQPELTPVCERVEREDIAGALADRSLTPASVWKPDGNPDVAQVSALARDLDADYLFISRIVDLDLEERAAPAQQGATSPPGLERRAAAVARAALFDARSGRVVWSDEREAAITFRTEYVRGQARIPRDEQCMVDAVRVAYAYLRFSLEEFKRRFDR